MEDINLRGKNAKLYLKYILIREALQIMFSLILVAIAGAITTLLYLYLTDGPVLFYRTDIGDIIYMFLVILFCLGIGLAFFHDAWWSYYHFYTLFMRVCKIDSVRKAEVKAYFAPEILMMKAKHPYRRNVESIDLAGIRDIRI